jgi:phage host-nuclease inhibitor protein Gam
MLQTVPREEQKDLLNRLRDEQNRKVGAVADLYENTINKMITEQTVIFNRFQLHCTIFQNLDQA